MILEEVSCSPEVLDRLAGLIQEVQPQEAPGGGGGRALLAAKSHAALALGKLLHCSATSIQVLQLSGRLITGLVQLLATARASGAVPPGAGRVGMGARHHDAPAGGEQRMIFIRKQDPRVHKRAALQPVAGDGSLAFAAYTNAAWLLAGLSVATEAKKVVFQNLGLQVWLGHNLDIQGFSANE